MESRENSQHAAKLFGTDGIRGRANAFPMTVEIALALGRAVGTIFRSHPGKHRVVIGKDTRLSCYMYENALIAGLCSMGVDTLMLGPLPTPAVAFITRAYRADAGVVISASHNPFCDNGIKFFSSEGFKLPDAWERQMEDLISRGPEVFEEYLPKEQEIGKNSRINDADGRYIEFVKATFPRKLSLKNLKIALDCAHGAGYKVAPLVFRELDAEVFVYGNVPNGLNINEGCGALYPELVQKAVIDHRADVGIALDGDADRVIMVDENAQIVDGDAILAICAKDMQQKGMLRSSRVVTTVMSNLGYVNALQGLGIEVVKSQIGDRYVIQEMLKCDAILGGEPSGHIIFSEHNTTGDGLVSALQVMRIMIETGSKLSELAAAFKRYPQVCINVKVNTKPPFEQLDGLKEVIQEVETALGIAGRVLVRYSGTEKTCRVMVEGPKRNSVQQFAESIANVIRKQIGVLH
ncbi:MAG: phosphoglucosamine mutase [Verrucomicrobia bacterium]|nr:phosphoglucosamine mutase [Verrucomicrobiota bacterium]